MFGRAWIKKLNKLYKRAIGGSNINSLDRDVDVDLKEKLACTLACSFRKEHSGNETLHAIFTEALNFGNFHILEDVKQQMRDTLNNCYSEVESNDCKLLHCIKIIESQFMDVVLTITNERPVRLSFENTNSVKKFKKIEFRMKWFKVMHMMIRSLQRHIPYKQ
ncbi:hypothetical protein TSAR_011146 [Trichomalopsis sarcophagae]|uniref:Uncharacterized protein n=1 Tax=Trichomalopsis sarcophagae TaxID=543379 RepID=A0A232FH98_9HYME|nr:hypothetical protein TSAR_011146 [Trichomalopsis sarcophagae]